MEPTRAAGFINEGNEAPSTITASFLKAEVRTRCRLNKFLMSRVSGRHTHGRSFALQTSAEDDLDGWMPGINSSPDECRSLWAFLEIKKSRYYNISPCFAIS